MQDACRAPSFPNSYSCMFSYPEIKHRCPQDKKCQCVNGGVQQGSSASRFWSAEDESLTENSEILLSAHVFFILQNIFSCKVISALIFGARSLHYQMCGSALYFITLRSLSLMSWVWAKRGRVENVCGRTGMRCIAKLTTIKSLLREQKRREAELDAVIGLDSDCSLFTHIPLFLFSLSFMCVGLGLLSLSSFPLQRVPDF